MAAKKAKSSPPDPVNSIREYRQAVIDFGRFACDVDQGKHPPLPLEELQQKKYALLKKVKEKHPGAVWAAVHHGKETLERISNLLGDLEHACYHHRFPEEGGPSPLSVILTLLPTLFTILDTLEQNIEKPTQINMDAENKDSEKAKVPVPPPRMILDRDTLTVTLDDVSYHGVDAPAFQLLEAIWHGNGVPVSSTTLKAMRGMRGKAVDRELNKLPPELRAIVKAKPGSGYWIQLPEKTEAVANCR